jgi:biopolymer transport protein ExbB/TolQ
MYSLISLEQKRNWDPVCIVRSIRILAQGLFVMFLIMWARRWWSGFYIPFARYIQAIYVLLYLMAWCVISGVIQRVLRYRVGHNQSLSFVREVAKAMQDANLGLAMAIAGRYRRSPSARAVASGLARFLSERLFLSDEEMLETIQRAMKHSAGVIHDELRRGLNLLASVGSTAPLVGAFGTVLGIVDSFWGVEGERWTVIAYVSESIAHALVLIDFSLILGMLTRWGYKHLTSQLEAFDMEMENESVKLLNYLAIYLGRQR